MNFHHHIPTESASPTGPAGMHHASPQSAPIVQLRDVAVALDGRTILSDINMEVQRGSFVAITGPNGGGKTTLLRTLLRLIRPTCGRVIYRDPQGREIKKLRIGYLPQKNMIDTRFPVTVAEVMLSGLFHSLRHRCTQADYRRLQETLTLVGADKFRNHPIGELSGGQLQRTLIGRALISRPELLVLDEPLSYVDKQFERQIYDIMATVARHTTIVLVSHEMSIISSMATHHLIVDHGIHPCHALHHYIPDACE
jgi:zinc transport system ATP-binding protein